MPIFDRLFNWITVEPTISLLMTITALVLFVTAYRRSQTGPDTPWRWLRRIIEAAAGVLLFLGLLWAFRLILNTNNDTFYSTHGSLSNASLQSAYSIWGRPHVQRDLGYAHYREVMVQEEIPQQDPTKPPLYKNVLQRQFVPQNSITKFRGMVDLSLSEREKGYALYSGYMVKATFEYDVVNNSADETECEFDFALSPGQTLYEDFVVTMDGQDISSQLSFAPDLVEWMMPFKPHQESHIVITYASRGMDSFYYQIPSQREIRDFKLTVSIDRLPVSLLNYPDGVLSPQQVEPTADGRGSVLTWELNQAITTAGMGVAILQPEQPGAQVSRVLGNSPYALTLLGTMLALTLIIRGQTVQFISLALLASAYCVQFLIMASVSDYALGFWGSLLLGALMTGVLTYFLFRRLPSRLLRSLIYGLVAFFAFAYPLSGLITDKPARNSFEGLVQVGLILYIFVLAIYTQIEREKPAAPTAAPATA